MVTQDTTIRVRYAETDQMRVVYYSHYFVWFEVGRCELLRSLGRSYRDFEATGFMLPVIEARCEYYRPARYDDELTIRTTGSLTSPARAQFTYEVHRPSDSVVTATGCTVHAAVDGAGKPTRLPVEIRDLLS